jgi:hypothetical protein
MEFKDCGYGSGDRIYGETVDELRNARNMEMDNLQPKTPVPIIKMEEGGGNALDMMLDKRNRELKGPQYNMKSVIGL